MATNDAELQASRVLAIGGGFDLALGEIETWMQELRAALFPIGRTPSLGGWVKVHILCDSHKPYRVGEFRSNLYCGKTSQNRSVREARHSGSRINDTMTLWLLILEVVARGGESVSSLALIQSRKLLV
jgi:hypothetical protein